MLRSIFAQILVCTLLLHAGPVLGDAADFPIGLDLKSPEELHRAITAMGHDEVDRESLRPNEGGFRYEVRVDDEALESLRAAGFTPVRLVDHDRFGREEAEATWRRVEKSASKRAFTFPLATYPTHAEIGDILADIAAAHPNLARIFPWGLSEQNRQMWGLVISDDVQNTEPEPEVRLSSTMHGNEVTGMILLLNLAEYLTTNHGQPGFERVTSLVDGHEIHFLPLHNPDGYVNNSRYNANFIDLNRNFDEPAGTHPTLQAENVNVMQYSLQQHFVLSQNGHGGALVVNYPWDYTPVRAPDDAALIELSLDYSRTNLPMYNGSFSQGITNGYDWYVALGTLQDWSYDQTECIDLTIELSNIKWPLASTLPSYWNDNRESLMSLVEGARGGLHGVVTDATNGAPLDAVITITGNPRPVSTDPAHGDYYKLLADGSYEVRVEAVGYVPQTFTDVAVTWGENDLLDVKLVSEATAVATPPAPVRFESIAPNPLNPATTIAFDVTSSQRVSLEVFDARGRRVGTLVDGPLPAGSHRVRWEGRDDAGRSLGSGVYFLRLEAGGNVRHAKAVLVQ